MVTAFQTTDPYTLVASQLQESPASRAELRVLTELEPELIDAAIHRFETMGSIIKFSKGGEEHFRWKAGVELPTESYRPQKFKEGIVRDEENRPNIIGRPRGWNLSAKVREFIDEQRDGAAFSMPSIYDWLMRHFPNACETYEARSLRTQISSLLLNEFAGRTITSLGRGEDGVVNVYRKGLAPVTTKPTVTPTPAPVTKAASPIKHGAPSRPLDYDRIFELRCKGLAIQKISEQLGYSYSTLNNRRAKDERLNDVLNRGWDVYSESELSGDEKNITETITSNATSAATESPQLHSAQLVPPDKNLDIAGFSISIEEENRATYALPAFIAELRAERDELDHLIALLERRMLRYAGGG